MHDCASLHILIDANLEMSCVIMACVFYQGCGVNFLLIFKNQLITCCWCMVEVMTRPSGIIFNWLKKVGDKSGEVTTFGECEVTTEHFFVS